MVKSPMERLRSGENIIVDSTNDDFNVRVTPATVWLHSHCCSGQLSTQQVKELHAALGAWLRINKLS
jgi:hypothetical protein